MSETLPVQDGLFDEDGLIGGNCAACGHHHFPLAGHCPWCGATTPSSARLSTEARLWAWTVVNTAPPGYDGPVPYSFGVVELPDDELHVVTLLTETDPGRLSVGEPMRFTTVAVAEGRSCWAFAPVTP
jgi:uncharacterized OB-fold protein